MPRRPTRPWSSSAQRRSVRWMSFSARGWSGCAAQIAFARRRGRDAPPLLLDAARRLAPLDARWRARRTSRRSRPRCSRAAWAAGPTARGAEAARSAPPAPRPPRPIDLLLDGLAMRFTDGYAAGVPPLRRALEASGTTTPSGTTSTGLAGVPPRPGPLGRRAVARAGGTQVPRSPATRGPHRPPIAPLPSRRGGARRRARAAAALIDEADAITQATGVAPLLYCAVAGRLARRGGRGAGADAAGVESAAARGEGRAIASETGRPAPLQRPRPVPGGAGRGAAACEHDDSGCRLGADRARRGGRPVRRRDAAAAALDG